MKTAQIIDRRLFYRTEKSRDKWKQRSDKYHKQYRASQMSLRDMTFRRDKWKELAITNKNLLKEKEAEIARLKQHLSNPDQPCPEDIYQPELLDLIPSENQAQDEILTAKPERYLYPIFIIQLAIQQRISCFSSWQGIAKTFQIWSQFFQIPTPNYNTIKQWFLKLGLFQLQQPKERRDDWIFILDTTWGQGQKKCFLIIGIPYQKWQNKIKNNYSNLQHRDMTVLSLDVLNVSNGKIIAEKISNLASQVGQPLQIISDHGPDLRKGIELYIEDRPQVIYTYDFTHQVALWLKYSFSENQVFQEFSKLADLTRPQIQLTSLYFLLPPKPRYKARFHNIDILVKWAHRVLNYWHKQDFSRISSNFETGKNKFLNRLGWVLDYQAEISLYEESLSVFRAAKKFLHQNGLHQNSSQLWLELSKSFPDSPLIKENIDRVTKYLTTEGAKIPNNKTFPAISDIIESLFSKYKTFSASSPYSEINEMVLSIVLATIRITPKKVFEAMSSISTSTLKAWIKEVFGESIMAKRKAAFSNI